MYRMGEMGVVGLSILNWCENLVVKPRKAKKHLRSYPGIMATNVSDYAVIGDYETAALVSHNGSIDWLCWPRFDSPACFAALIGSSANGHWLVCPVPSARTSRRYRPHSLILEKTFKTEEGQVTLIDFMPAREKCPHLIRIIRADHGTVQMRMNVACVLTMAVGHHQSKRTVRIL